MNSRIILQRVWHEPPVFFPVLALFHLFLLARAVVDFSSGAWSNGIMLTLFWYALGAGLSVGVLLLKRWAAIAYLAFAATGLILNLALPKGTSWHQIGETLFPVDAVMMLLIFLFYKRFR